MTTANKQAYIYAGLAGEGDYVGEGGLYRRAASGGEWESITNGLPAEPQVRALLVHPENGNVVYAGTNLGVYRSDDHGDHWEALASEKKDVWSLAFHPDNPDVIFAGFEPCAISRSQDGGKTWSTMNTERVKFPHITTYMPPLGKRVIDIAADPSNPMDMYGAIEVGGLLGQPGRRRELGVVDRWPLPAQQHPGPARRPSQFSRPRHGAHNHPGRHVPQPRPGQSVGACPG